MTISLDLAQLNAALAQLDGKVRGSEFLPLDTSLFRSGADGLDAGQTDAERVLAAASQSTDSASRGSLARNSNTPETCSQRGEGNDDGRRPGSYMPSRQRYLGSKLTGGSASPHLKDFSMFFEWRAAGGLAYYCGDDYGDRGYENEAKVRPNGPRWSTDWLQEGLAGVNVGIRLSNLPFPKYDDLDRGGANPSAYETQDYPDFSLTTAYGRALKYRRIYYTRFTTNRGQSDSGSVLWRGSSTHRPDRIGFYAYCKSKNGNAASCMFTQDTTCLGSATPGGPYLQLRTDFYADGRDQPLCTLPEG